MKSVGGYSYVEILVASFILVVALVPASNALRATMQASDGGRTLLVQQYKALGRMETVLTTQFSLLEAEAATTNGTTPSSHSDVAGTPNRALVMLAPYDIDGDLVNDPGVVQVTVSIENTTIQFQTVAGMN